MNAQVQFISEATRTLAAYIAGAGAQATPDDVLEKARHHLLDTLAAHGFRVALALGPAGQRLCASPGRSRPVHRGGHPHPDRGPRRGAGQRHDGARRRNRRLTPWAGAFIRAAASCPAYSPRRSLNKSSGLAMLKAVALGYDIGTRFNLSLGPRKLYAGGHSTHSVGPLFGGAAAAASLMGPERRANSLCVGVTTVQQASGGAVLVAGRAPCGEGLRLRRYAGAQRHGSGHHGGCRLHWRARCTGRAKQFLHSFLQRSATRRTGARVGQPLRDSAGHHQKMVRGLAHPGSHRARYWR